jgi:hypothetical protein
MLTAPQINLALGIPDRMIMMFRDLDEESASRMAEDATWRARQRMPRVTGLTASRVHPIWGRRWFGLTFDQTAWRMEHGTGPHTMRSLAGKTVPMWITDTDGSARRDNPKAKVRVTEDGRTQVLIFRKVAKIGARVTKRTKWGTVYQAPASYPGAPGRISRRTPGAPWTPVGGKGGAVASGNVGVRWRHPGVRSMQFLNSALAETAFDSGLIIEPIYVADSDAWRQVLSRKVEAV